jgi:hypothetical protein
MRRAVTESDTEEALRVLERNRAQLAASLARAESDRHDRFPRSATFRWIIRHLAGRSLAATAGALLLRMALRRVKRAMRGTAR